MRRHLLDLAILLVVATAACAAVALQAPGDRRAALHAYFLFLGALLMFVVVSGVGEAVPVARGSSLRRALDEPPATPTPVPQLAKVEREVTLSVANAYDLHVRLLPHLREVAAARLERSGRRPGPETLGAFWPLLRPDRPAPEDRFARGIGERDLRALVAFLEEL